MAITKATASSIAPAAKGSIVVGSATNDAGVLAVGTNTHILVADSTETLGMKWAAPAGGGKVLQVVSATTSTTVTVAVNTYTDTGLTATITPTLATSNILVLLNQNGTGKQTTDTAQAIRLLRGASDIALLAGSSGDTQSSARNFQGSVSTAYLDSPATTSATTYKTQTKSNDGTAEVRVQNGNAVSTITLLEIGV